LSEYERGSAALAVQQPTVSTNYTKEVMEDLAATQDWVTLREYAERHASSSNHDTSLLARRMLAVSLSHSLATSDRQIAREHFISLLASRDCVVGDAYHLAVLLLKKINWVVRAPKFEFQIPDALFALDDRSTLGVSMQYIMESSKLHWDAVGAHWYQDEQGKSNIGLRRKARPPATAKSEIRTSFADMWERRPPYDGQVSRPTATTFKAMEVVNTPGSESHKSSSDVVYELSVELEGREAWKQIPEILKRIAADSHILECCIGADVDARAAAAQGPPEAAPVLLGGKRERWIGLAAGSDDRYRGKDVRGRLMSQDFRDYLWDPQEKPEAQTGAARGRTLGDWSVRYNALIQYWVIVPALIHNRDLWSPFLKRNALNTVTGHSVVVNAAEAELQRVLKEHPPAPDWPDAANTLRLAYIRERSVTTETMLKNREPASFVRRNTDCPAPATSTSGFVTPMVSVAKKVEDFYPKAAREDQIEGTVIVLAKVDAKGCAVETGIVGSSGSEALDHAAIDYLQSIEFSPAFENDTAVEGKYRASVVFKLPSD
jgi:TonB family protein